MRVKSEEGLIKAWAFDYRSAWACLIRTHGSAVAPLPSLLGRWRRFPSFSITAGRITVAGLSLIAVASRR